MSFETWVQWFERGEKAAVSRRAIEQALGGVVASRHGARLIVHHGSLEIDVHLNPAAGDVTCVTFRRPSSDPAVWHAMYELVRLGHGMCYWPGSPPVVASEDTAAHLPGDLVASLGAPVMARDGAAIASLLKRT